MPELTFSIKEALSFGWSKMKSHFKIFFGLILLQILLSFFFRFITEALDIMETRGEINFFLYLLIYLVIIFISVTIGMGIIKITLKIHDDEKPEIKDLTSCYPLALNYVVASILCGVAIALGMLALIVPGIILAIKFSFVDYFIVDKKTGPIEAIKQSWQITKRNKLKLLLFFFVLGLINVLGVICLIVGLFASIPVTMMAMIFVYRKLLTQSQIAWTNEKFI